MSRSSNPYPCRILVILALVALASLAAAPAAAQTTAARSSMIDLLFTDADGSGGVTCGDEINYVVTVDGDGSGINLLDVVWELAVPANAEVVPGSVIPANPFDTARVVSGNSPGDRLIRVELGELCQNPQVCGPNGASMTFHLRILNPNLSSELSVQGTVSGLNFPTTVTDDLATSDPLDPTLTPYPACPPPPEPELEATKNDLLDSDADGDGLADGGETLRYAVILRSTGSGTAEAVVYRLQPDPATTLIAGSVTTTAGTVTAGNRPGDGSVEVRVGDLAPGAVVSLSYRVTIHDPVPLGVNRVVCQGTVSGTNFPDLRTDDPQVAGLANPTVTPLDFDPDLGIAKDDGGATGSPGGLITYRLDYTNASRSPASGVVLSETVPGETRFAGGASSAGWSCRPDTSAGSTCTLGVGELAAGASGSTTFAVRVAQALPAGVTRIENLATIGDDGTHGPERNPADNSASDSTPLTGLAPALEVTKTPEPGSEPRPGGLLLWRLGWANTGNQEAVGVELGETVPAHTRFEPGASDPAWSCSGTAAGSTCTLAVGSVAAGASGSAVFAVRLADPLPAGVETVENCAVLDTQQACHTFAVEAAPDLALSKDDGGANVEPGGTVVYTLGFENLGEQGASGVLLTDTVPAHTRFEPGASAPAWSCSAGTPGSTCTLAVGNLASGASGSRRIAFRVDSTLPAGVTRITNSAAISDDGAGGPDTDPANNTASDTTPLVGLGPELAVVKALETGSDPRPGGVLLWRIDYQNHGNQEALGVELAETVPTATSFVASASDPAWSCSAAGAGSACTLLVGNLPAGGSGSAVFAARIADPLPAGVEEVENCAAVTAAGGDLAQGCTTTGIDGASVDLAVAKSDHGTAASPAQTLTYRLEATNLGNRGATGAVLTETVPAHTRFEPGASEPGWSCTGSGQAGEVCTFELGELAGGGASASVAFAVTVAAALPAGVSEITNTVTVSDDGTGGPDADPANNSATEITPLTGAMPELSVAKSFEPAASEPRPGGLLVWTVTVANTGNQAAAGVVLAERVPAHTTFLPERSDAGWSCQAPAAGSTCSLPAGELAPGEQVSAVFAVRIDEPLPAGVDGIENCAEVGAAEGCDSVSLPEAVPDLAVAKDDGGVTVSPGGSVTYQLRYDNHGNQGATGVVVTDLLPPEVSFSAGASDPRWVCEPPAPEATRCRLEVGALGAGGSGSAAIAVTVPVDLPATVEVLTNRARVDDDGTNGADPVPEDNLATDTTPVVAAPPPPPPEEARLEITLTDLLALDADASGDPSAGDTLTYVVRVSNRGPAPAEAVVFTVEPDPHSGLLPGSVTTTHGTVASGNGAGHTAVAVELGALPAGGGADVTFAVEIDSELPPDLRRLSVQGFGQGANAASEPSDDPDTPEDDDPTVTQLSGGGPETVPEIPTLSQMGFALFWLSLAAGAVVLLRRRRGWVSDGRAS